MCPIYFIRTRVARHRCTRWGMSYIRLGGAAFSEVRSDCREGLAEGQQEDIISSKGWVLGRGARRGMKTLNITRSLETGVTGVQSCPGKGSQSSGVGWICLHPQQGEFPIWKKKKKKTPSFKGTQLGLSPSDLWALWLNCKTVIKGSMKINR